MVDAFIMMARSVFLLTSDKFHCTLNAPHEHMSRSVPSVYTQYARATSRATASDASLGAHTAVAPSPSQPLHAAVQPGVL